MTGLARALSARRILRGGHRTTARRALRGAVRHQVRSARRTQKGR